MKYQIYAAEYQSEKEISDRKLSVELYAWATRDINRIQKVYYTRNEVPLYYWRGELNISKYWSIS